MKMFDRGREGVLNLTFMRVGKRIDATGRFLPIGSVYGEIKTQST